MKMFSNCEATEKVYVLSNLCFGCPFSIPTLKILPSFKTNKFMSRFRRRKQKHYCLTHNKPINDILWCLQFFHGAENLRTYGRTLY